MIAFAEVEATIYVFKEVKIGFVQKICKLSVTKSDETNGCIDNFAKLEKVTVATLIDVFVEFIA